MFESTEVYRSASISLLIVGLICQLIGNNFLASRELLENLLHASVVGQCCPVFGLVV